MYDLLVDILCCVRPVVSNLYVSLLPAVNLCVDFLKKKPKGALANAKLILYMQHVSSDYSKRAAISFINIEDSKYLWNHSDVIAHSSLWLIYKNKGGSCVLNMFPSIRNAYNLF